MNTPTRRQFLQTLAGLALGPIIAARALAATKSTPSTSTIADMLDCSDIPIRIEPLGIPALGCAIEVPSNRYLVEDHDAICRNGYHSGENAYHVYVGKWDGTLKLEHGCDNPAYIFADLVKRAGGDVDWQSVYHYGQYCDELVPDWMVMYDEGNLRMDASVAQMQDRSCHRARFTANVICRTKEEMSDLCANLSMRYRVWKATDPRYQRSFPVYPGDAS